MKLISAKTIIGLSALLLFSCNNEDFLNQTEEGEPCNYICFGIAPDGGAQTKGGNQTNAKACTADRFVLRSADSADTLCVRTLISDGIQTAGNKAVTRGEPVTTEAFYDNFHVLTVKDQETSFFMKTSPKSVTIGRWTTLTTGREQTIPSSSMLGLRQMPSPHPPAPKT